jgi:hypothetical protein
LPVQIDRNGCNHPETSLSLEHRDEDRCRPPPTQAPLLDQIKRGSFSSRDDLVSKLMRYITSHNETAAPFTWTYTGEPLKAAS